MNPDDVVALSPEMLEALRRVLDDPKGDSYDRDLGEC